MSSISFTWGLVFNCNAIRLLFKLPHLMCLCSGNTHCHHSIMMQSAKLVPLKQRISSTGTGCTFIIPEKHFQMMQGERCAVVYKLPSNWKELKTLHLSFLFLQNHFGVSIWGTAAFDFTHNSTIYLISYVGYSKISCHLIW